MTTRRTFLKLVGANAALTGLAACSEQPVEKILPYTVVPPGVAPGGEVVRYATSFVLDGYATGLLVSSRDGRPTKIDGNPAHPASLGAAGVFEQASVLGLYDPHRARGVKNRGAPSTLDRLARLLKERHGDARDRGEGLRILLEPQSSPLMEAILGRLRERFPEARVTHYSPAAGGQIGSATEAAFGRRLSPLYRFEGARVVVMLDADVLSQGPMHLRYAREVAAGRVPDANGGMSRLYVAEPTPTPTGSIADHRIAVRSLEIGPVARALLARVRGETAPSLAPNLEAWLRATASDLERHRGTGLVVAGARQPAQVHAAVFAINEALSNVGRTLKFVAEPLLPSDQSLADLVREMHAGRVERLFMLDVNPVHSTPADLGFREALSRVGLKVLSGLYENETAAHVDWFVPAAHYLESWGDARAGDGTLSLVQPLIAPLFAGKTTAEMLWLTAHHAERTSHDLLVERYRSRAPPEADFEKDWERLLAAGFAVDSAFAEERVPPSRAVVADSPPSAGIELNFVISPSVYDGRFANNVWLLELPEPITKLSWDNALLVSPKTARRLQVDSEDVVEIEYRGRKLEAPVLVVPGQADDTFFLHLGWGRSGSERNVGAGVDAYRLRTSEALEFGAGVEIVKTGRKALLARTQTHAELAGRHHVVAATLTEYTRGIEAVAEQRGPVEALVSPPGSRGPQWAMTIDLARCFGCGGCVVACQAENNVATVGKSDVLRSREMYWLRIDTYTAGAPDHPTEFLNQPMLCQHCEKAPCEYVCPVFATTHSPDGLNEMTYNRCVGTRFCSNNCPYKVRRFNWFEYGESDLRNLQRNPEVTVRERGVMEKCTYCVQRIRSAGIRAEVSGRAEERTVVTTACQDACPSQAIVFGDLTNPESAVSRTRQDPRAYEALHELGTIPRTRYLARIKNPSETLG